MTPISDRNSPEALRRRAKIEQQLAADFTTSALLAERKQSKDRYERLSLEALAVSDHCLRRATELEALEFAAFQRSNAGAVAEQLVAKYLEANAKAKAEPEQAQNRMFDASLPYGVD